MSRCEVKSNSPTIEELCLQNDTTRVDFGRTVPHRYPCQAEKDAVFSVYRPGNRTGCTSTVGSTPSGRGEEVLVAQALTNANRIDSILSDSNLVSGLFFEREIDTDLRIVIEAWPRLSDDIRAAILRIAER